jgi:hypothetical protein
MNLWVLLCPKMCSFMLLCTPYCLTAYARLYRPHAVSSELKDGFVDIKLNSSNQVRPGDSPELGTLCEATGKACFTLHFDD